MASVRKIGSSWYGRWTNAAGARVERVLQAQGAREARAEAAAQEAKARGIRRGWSDGTEDLTVAQVHERYAPVYARQAAGSDKAGRFKRILKAFGSRKLRQVRPADVERFLATLLEEPESLAPQTVEHHRIALAALYTFAIKKERVYRGDNPARLAEKVAVPQKPPRYLEARHVQAVIDQVPAAWRNFFALAVYTGLRAGELRGIRAADVDTVRRVAWVWRSNARDTTKGGKLRVVPVPAEAMPYVMDQLSRVTSEFLFATPTGKQLPAKMKMVPILKRALVKSGLVVGYELECRVRHAAFGEENGRSKLTAEQAKLIRRRSSEGHSQTALAIAFCVSRRAIGLVLAGENWATPGKPGCGYTERAATAERKPCPRCGKLLWATPVPMRLTFHDLRKTHGTHLYEATGDLRVVQRIHGHSDPRLTEGTYVGVSASRMVEQADKLTFKSASHVLPRNGTETDGTGQQPADCEGGKAQ